ncbi:MAG: sulfate reduction electron transfer complex DsrMKJOP subunit DsrM [bacterium]
MGVISALISVIVLVLLAYTGVNHARLNYLFGVTIPYAAVLIFFLGFIYRVLNWARSPVPFRITTTCGQQKTLPWIKQSHLESPSGIFGVLGRMFLEVFFFRSLFRNTRAELREGQRLTYGSSKWLWMAGMAFHWCFLVIFIRHLRFFTMPIPTPLHLIEGMDGLLQIGAPRLYMTDLIFLGAVGFLFLRRVVIPQVRYISLPADYFPLFLILAIGASGVLMRYFTKVDIAGVKDLTMGLATLHPHIPGVKIGSIFYIHIFLVSVLFIYFPFSKLMHMGGVFLSPTRNLANNNRMVRHVNPWNYPVKVHTYEEYEEEFRAKMIKAEIPVEKE